MSPRIPSYSFCVSQACIIAELGLVEERLEQHVVGLLPVHDLAFQQRLEEHLELLVVVGQGDDAYAVVLAQVRLLLLEPDPVGVGEVHPEPLVQRRDQR